MAGKKLSLPIRAKDIAALKSGDSVILSGKMLTARDGSHKRMVESLRDRKKLAFSLNGRTIYYMGPTPARPGQTIGSSGPTTSARMDIYTPLLLQKGVKCMIGKGKRSEEVRIAMQKNKAVYLAVVGGAGALIAKTIKKARRIAYDDLGTEAVYELEVENLPAVVINDIYGGDLYSEGRNRYRKTQV